MTSIETTTLTPDRQTQRWRHAFVYFWLSFGTLFALAHLESLVRRSLALALVAVLAAWYWHWQVTEDGAGSASSARGRWWRVRPVRAYIAGAVLLWGALVLLDSTFAVAGVAVVAPYCFSSARWALVSLVPCTGAWLWQGVAHAGGLAWEEVAVAVVVVASGVAVAGYIGSLTRQNTERQQLIEQLQAAQAELAAVERRAGTLAERHRLARDIHDTLTQGFASIVMLLEAAGASLDSGHAANPPVARALRSARDNLTESRRLVWALRPDALAGGRLSDALADLVARLDEENGVATELVITGTPRNLSQDAETALWRLTQEALTNIRKHATATRVTVTVSYMDDVTVLDVQDDGLGFEPSLLDGNGQGPGGLGLRAMRERAEELGGRLVVETAPGEGTTVVAEIPRQPGSVDTALRREAGS